MQRSEINKKTSFGGKIPVFKHRELSESEATLSAHGTGTSQQVPPLPDQRGILVTPGLCTVTAQSFQSAQEMHLFASPAFRHFNRPAAISVRQEPAAAIYTTGPKEAWILQYF